MSPDIFLLTLAETAASTLPPPPPKFVSSGLTESTVDLIRTSILSASECAALFGISRVTAWRIQTGRYHVRPRNGPRWNRVSDATVEEIRLRHEDAGWSVSDLARHYGLPRTTIQAFCLYRRR